MDVLEIADQLVKLTIYPHFELCHMVICCLNIRNDLGQGALFFSRRHPFACWLTAMLTMFSSTLLSNFMLNEPIVGAFSNTQHTLMGTLVWYVMFYTPFDLSAKLCNFLPVRAILETSNELYRCNRIHYGVTLTSRIYPNSYFAIWLMGVIQGNGSGLIKSLERLFRGANITPAISEFMQPTSATKYSLLASLIFIIDRKKSEIYLLNEIPHNLIYLCLVLFFVYFKLSSLLFGLHDPFLPLENLMSALLFGGIWDAIERVLSHTSSANKYRQNSSINNNNNYYYTHGIRYAQYHSSKLGAGRHPSLQSTNPISASTLNSSASSQVLSSTSFVSNNNRSTILSGDGNSQQALNRNGKQMCMPVERRAIAKERP